MVLGSRSWKPDGDANKWSAAAGVTTPLKG